MFKVGNPVHVNSCKCSGVVTDVYTNSKGRSVFYDVLLDGDGTGESTLVRGSDLSLIWEVGDERYDVSVEVLESLPHGSAIVIPNSGNGLMVVSDVGLFVDVLSGDALSAVSVCGYAKRFIRPIRLVHME